MLNTSCGIVPILEAAGSNASASFTINTTTLLANTYYVVKFNALSNSSTSVVSLSATISSLTLFADVANAGTAFNTALSNLYSFTTGTNSGVLNFNVSQTAGATLSWSYTIFQFKAL